MSDTDEHIADSKNVNNYDNGNNNIDAHTSKTSSRTIFRYSKDTLLSLHNSPLVCKPENMPPLSSWFGEEAGAPALSKNMLNGSGISRSADKSIVLGPSKTNFASSLYGGLKQTTEYNGGATPGPSKSTSRTRKSEDSTRMLNGNHNGSINNRISRGQAYGGEKGHHHHNHHHHHHHHHINNNNNNHQHHHSRYEKAGMERRTSNTFGNQSVSQNKRFNQSDHQGERHPSSGGRKDFNHDQRIGNRNHYSSHNDMNSIDQDRVPEWMDYNPAEPKKITDADDTLESHGDFANDLEAWKSSMKKKEGLVCAQKNANEGSLSTANTNDNSESKILDLSALDLTPSSTTCDTIPAASLSPSFNSSITPPDLPIKRGSRFAKFFAKREEESHIASTTSSPLAHESMKQGQAKSVNVNDLFQLSDGVQSTEMMSDQISSRDVGPSTSDLHGQDAPANVRVFSEEDLLQSMGARKSMASPEEIDQNAIGFNRVLQILSQPKPTAPMSPSSYITVTSTETNVIQKMEKQPSHSSNEKSLSNEISSPICSPNMDLRPFVNTDVSTSLSAHVQQPSTPPTKSKKVSQLFGGNLPTSVLRQLSARSEGRSPSLSSNKSGQSGRFSLSTPNSQNGSPLTGHASPSPVHVSSTPQQPNPFSQVYHSVPTRGSEFPPNASQLHQSNFAIQESGPTNGPHPTRTRYDNDRMALPPPHMFANGEPGMPPPPSLSALHQHPDDTMNRIISSPSAFNQQPHQHHQQSVGERPFLPPQQHHQQRPPMPPPSMMGMPAQHPMMSPHLSMHLQGAPVNSIPPPPPFIHQHPHPPPLMPGMLPPMGMGIPQNMYTSKTQGWNNQQ